MKLIILIALLISTESFGQISNRLGFDWGFQGPDLAIQFRTRVKIINNLEFNLGVDLNKCNTLGRLIGLDMYFGNWQGSKDRIYSIFFGVDYDNTSSGILYFGNSSNNSGSYFIEKNQYFIPKLGYRIYHRNIFLEHLPFRDLSISLVTSYKFRLSQNSIYLRSGIYNEEAEQYLNGFVRGGFNAFLGLPVGLNHSPQIPTNYNTTRS